MILIGINAADDFLAPDAVYRNASQGNEQICLDETE